VELARASGLDMRFWHKTGPLANIVALDRATNVLIEDITTINSSEWCMRLAECNRLYIRGVHLFSDLDQAVNSDGIDLVSSKNVVISDCVLMTADGGPGLS
jgi:polygalacturonase